MEDSSVVPAGSENGSTGTRSRWTAVVVTAVAAAVAVLWGSSTSVRSPPSERGEVPAPPLVFTTTTTTTPPEVSALEGEWVPTWFPGEGRFGAVARLPGGGGVAAQVKDRGGTSTTLWRSDDDTTWEIFAELDGVVTGLASGSDVVVAVGATIEGDPLADVVDTSPTVWLLDPSRGTVRVVDLPGGPGGVMEVTTIDEDLVAVGWRGTARMWPELSPSPDPRNEPAAWWSEDGITWQSAEVDTGGWDGGALWGVAGGAERMVAGGEGGGAARLWESTDAGRRWMLTEGDRVWPTGQVFRSVAATDTRMVAVSATLVDDTPRAILWRRGPDGWGWAEPEGLAERLVTEVGVVGDELVAIAAGALGTSSQMWTSPDGRTWEQVLLPDPCLRCPFGGSPGRRLWVGGAVRDLVVGAAAGQPVVWSRRPGEVLTPTRQPGWERVDLEVPGRVAAFVVYHSAELTVIQAEGVRIMVGDELVQPSWGSRDAGQVEGVVRVGGAWYLSGWSDGREPAVWRSVDGVNWTVVAEARPPVAPLIVLDDGPTVVGIGPVAVDPDLETVDVATAPEGVEYVYTAVPWEGGVVALGAGAGYRQLLVGVGVDPPTLPEGATAVGLVRVGDRLVVGGEGEEGDPRVVVYGRGGTVVADLPVPFSPWSLGTVGELAVATDPSGSALWVSADGEEWTPIPVDVRHGFPGVLAGRGVVFTDGDLVVRGVDRGIVGVWRWTAPLPGIDRRRRAP